MKVYSCKLRLHGVLFNEVYKSYCTAAEIILLRKLHVGDNDAVLDLKPAKAPASGERGPWSDDWTHREERERLANLYSLSNDAARVADPGDSPGAILVRDLFGPDHLPLPEKLDEVKEDVVPDEPVVRRRVGRPAAAPVDPVEAALAS